MKTLGDIADALGASVPDARRGAAIVGIASPRDADDTQIAFVADQKHAKMLAATKAAAVVIARGIAERPASPEAVVLEVADAPAALQRTLELLSLPTPRPPVGVHPSSVLAGDVVLGKGVRVGPHCTLGGGVTLGHNVVLHSGVVLGDGVTVGDDSELFPHVVVRERCTIGCRVTHQRQRHDRHRRLRLPLGRQAARQTAAPGHGGRRGRRGDRQRHLHRPGQVR